MAEHRRYSRKVKAAAVVEAALSTVTAASEAMDIPRQTIQYWVESEEFSELRRKTREDQAEGWSVLGQLAQAELKKRVPTMEARDLVILAGLATDKSQLLSGHATARTETRDITDNLDDTEREALRNAIDEYLKAADVPEPV